MLETESDVSSAVSATMRSKPGDTTGYPTPEDVGRLRRHPRFGEASLHAAAGITRQYEGNWVLNRLLGDRGRTIMGLAILDLHYNRADEGGLTATALKHHCTELGICSPGRVTAMLGALKMLGLLAEVHGTDRRVRRLRPTDRFLALHRDRRRCFFEALAKVMPEGELALQREGDPDFVAAHMAAFARMFMSGMRLVDYVPELETVFRRDAGMLILMMLAVEARREGRDPFASLAVTITGLAKRASASRGHVLSVLRDAEEQAMVVRSGERGDGIAVTGSLLEAVDRFVAAILSLHLVAIREVPALKGPDPFA